MSLPVTLFLCVVGVGAGLLVVAVLAIAAWVAVNIVSDGIAERARKAGQP